MLGSGDIWESWKTGNGGDLIKTCQLKFLNKNKPFIMYACEYQWTICEVQFFVSVCGLWGSNLGLKALQQVSLPTEVS